MSTPLTNVKGIGPATANALADAGITTAEKLAATSVEKLTAVPGFGELRAKVVIAQAQALVKGDAADTGGVKESKKDDRKQGKGKKKKKKAIEGKAASKEKIVKKKDSKKKKTTKKTKKKGKKRSKKK
jgi:transcription termination factor NusA